MSLMDNDLTDCALWQSDENICELQDPAQQTQFDGMPCDPSGYYYGTSDSRDPKFCAYHFYTEVVSGDGKTNNKLVRDDYEVEPEK